MIVDLPQLQQLSGMTKPAAVKRWLKANGVPFMVQPSGYPVTTMDAVNRALLGGGHAISEPDWSFVTQNFRKHPSRSKRVT